MLSRLPSLTLPLLLTGTLLHCGSDDEPPDPAGTAGSGVAATSGTAGARAGGAGTAGSSTAGKSGQGGLSGTGASAGGAGSLGVGGMSKGGAAGTSGAAGSSPAGMPGAGGSNPAGAPAAGGMGGGAGGENAGAPGGSGAAGVAGGGTAGTTGGTAGTTGGTAGTTGGTAGTTGGTCAALPAHTVNARAHLDSWGVVFTPGDQPGADAARLDRIGVRRLRTALALGSLPSWQSLQDQMTGAGYPRPRLRFDDLVTAYNNVSAITWEAQKPAILAAAAAGLLTSLEGPNEMNNYSTGGGTHGVDDPTDQTKSWAGPDGNVQAWARAIHDWKASLSGADAAAMAPVEFFAPTIASGEASDYASLPDLGSLVDFGTIHFYAGHGYSPGLEQINNDPSVGYFSNVYTWAQKATAPGKAMVVSECGATTPPGSGYSPLGQARYLLMQLHDGAAVGAHALYFYTMYDPSTGQGGDEGNFGLFHTDGSEKPVVGALASLQQLLSLHNNASDPANATDTGCFAPGLDGSAVSVTGIGFANFASHVADVVIYPKSDGSTLLSVTNEPNVSDANGQDKSTPTITATVHLGSVQSWHLYDVLSASPLEAQASGTGDTVPVSLSGYPKYVLLDPPPGYTP